MVFEYIQERLRTAYRYFARPQSRNGHATAERDAPPPAAARPTGTRSVKTKRGENEDRANSSDDEDEEEDEDDEEDEAGDEERLVSTGLARLLVEDEDGVRQSSSPTPSPHNGLFPDSDEEERDEGGRNVLEQDDIAPEDLHYTFDRMIFTGGKVAEKILFYEEFLTPQRC